MSREGSDADDGTPLSHLSREPTEKNYRKKLTTCYKMYTWQTILVHLLLYISGALNIMRLLRVLPKVRNQPRQQLCASLQYMDANAYLQRTGTQKFVCAESYAGLQTVAYM